MHDAQALAVTVLQRVLAGRNLDTELAAAWRNLPPDNARLRALVQDLCYGVLRHLGPLDAMLQPLLASPLRDERLRHLLCVALYQLRYTRAAPHAVVDQAVRACTALHAVPAKGLVNAVLRNFLRRKAELLAASQHSDAGRYSFPPWWIARLRTQYPENFSALLDAGNQHAPLTLRVNRRRISRDAYLAQLAAAGIAARALERHAVVLDQPLPVARIPGFDAGLVSVQDASAQRAAPLLDARDSMRVLDACAAPGGKSAHLLELADLSLTAVDRDAVRLARIDANLLRLGLTANVVCGDAADPQAWWDGEPFERILADVPCTASGVTRRHPDIKWVRRETDVAQFAQQQQTILDALWRLLASGGKFLYATCSVFREENQLQIVRFLERNSDAQRVALPADECPDAPVQQAGQILPDALHDGFFYALLQKN